MERIRAEGIFECRACGFTHRNREAWYAAGEFAPNEQPAAASPLAEADLTPSAPVEDDGYDTLRLRVSDPDLPWTDRDRIALDKLLREHARLTAALHRLREDAERWRCVRTILAEDHWPLTGHTTISASTYKIQSLPHHATVEEVVDAARARPEGSNE